MADGHDPPPKNTIISDEDHPRTERDGKIGTDRRDRLSGKPKRIAWVTTSLTGIGVKTVCSAVTKGVMFSTGATLDQPGGRAQGPLISGQWRALRISAGQRLFRWQFPS